MEMVGSMVEAGSNGLVKGVQEGLADVVKEELKKHLAEMLSPANSAGSNVKVCYYLVRRFADVVSLAEKLDEMSDTYKTTVIERIQGGEESYSNLHSASKDARIKNRRLYFQSLRPYGCSLTLSTRKDGPVGDALWSVMRTFGSEFVKPEGCEHRGLMSVLLVLLDRCFSFLEIAYKLEIYQHASASEFMGKVIKVADSEFRFLDKKFDCVGKLRDAKCEYSRFAKAIYYLKRVLDRVGDLKKEQGVENAVYVVNLEVLLWHLVAAARIAKLDPDIEEPFCMLESDRTNFSMFKDFYSPDLLDYRAINARLLPGGSDLMGISASLIKKSEFSNALRIMNLLILLEDRKYQFLEDESEYIQGMSPANKNKEKQRTRIYYLLRLLAVFFRHSPRNPGSELRSILQNLISECRTSIDLYQENGISNGPPKIGDPIPGPGSDIWAFELISKQLRSLRDRTELQVDLNDSSVSDDIVSINNLIKNSFNKNIVINMKHATRLIKDMLGWMIILVNALQELYQVDTDKCGKSAKVYWGGWNSRFTMMVSSLDTFKEFFEKEDQYIQGMSSIEDSPKWTQYSKKLKQVKDEITAFQTSMAGQEPASESESQAQAKQADSDSSLSGSEDKAPKAVSDSAPAKKTRTGLRDTGLGEPLLAAQSLGDGSSPSIRDETADQLFALMIQNFDNNTKSSLRDAHDETQKVSTINNLRQRLVTNVLVQLACIATHCMKQCRSTDEERYRKGFVQASLFEQRRGKRLYALSFYGVQQAHESAKQQAEADALAATFEHS